MTPITVYAALHAEAPQPLGEWMEENREELINAMPTKRTRAKSEGRAKGLDAAHEALYRLIAFEPLRNMKEGAGFTFAPGSMGHYRLHLPDGAYDQIVRPRMAGVSSPPSFIAPSQVKAVRDRLLAEGVIVPTNKAGVFQLSGRTAPARVEPPAGMSLSEAVAWMQEQTRHLVDTTVFEAGRMKDDMVGASGSTYAALQNYTQMGYDAPLAVHADALELLRIHSKTQLDRAMFDEAYAAIREAMRAEGKTMPREGARPYIYAGKTNGSKKLKGGGSYAWTGTDLEIVTGKSTAVAGALRRGGALSEIAKYRDVGRGDFTIVLKDLTKMAEFAAGMRALGFTEMADAIDQNRPMWEKQAGVTEKRAEQDRRVDQERRAAEEERRAPPTGTPEAGEVKSEGTRWEWDPEKFQVKLFTRERSFQVAQSIGNGAKYINDAGTYYVALPTRSEMITDALGVMLRLYPKTAAAMMTHVPTWAAVKSALKQSREAGVTEEGSWTLVTLQKRNTKGQLVPVEYVDVKTMFMRDPETNEPVRWWRRVPSATFEYGSKSVRAPVKKIKDVADALRPWFPRLAEAIGRAFGEVAGVVDEELAEVAARVDLSDKFNAGELTDPRAVAVVRTVRETLTKVLPKGLYPFDFQELGVAFAMLSEYRCLLGDSQGLGKTIQAICALLMDPARLLPAVAVVPKNVLYNWEDEIKVWAPRIPVFVVEDSATRLPQGFRGVVITSYTVLSMRAAEFADAGFATAIFDEAHYMKNSTRQRSKAGALLSAAVPHVLDLTGTPLKNTVVELHALLTMLDPETWGTKKSFAEQFVKEEKTIALKDGKSTTKYVGVKSASRLRLQLAAIQIRREKSAAKGRTNSPIANLPPKRRMIYKIDMAPSQLRTYLEAVERFQEWLRDTVERKVRADLERAGESYETASRGAIQAAEEKVARAMQAEIIVKLGELRRLVGLMKVPYAIEAIKKLVNAGEPVVAFCAFQPVVLALAAALKAARIPYGIIDGSTPAKERRNVVKAFQAGDIDVIVGSEAAKEGITLTRSCNVIQVERYWTPADEEQAEDRTHRIGQTRAVTVHQPHMIARGMDTIDDYMSTLIEEKRALVAQIIGAEDVETDMTAAGEAKVGDASVVQQDRAETVTMLTRAMLNVARLSNPRRA